MCKRSSKYTSNISVRGNLTVLPISFFEKDKNSYYNSVAIIDSNGEILGKFSHIPEPLAENLTQLSKEVLKHKADFGIAVDPDVDRLVFFDEKGIIFGEEYTQVVCSDYVLSNKKGNTVSTLSSSKKL